MIVNIEGVIFDSDIDTEISVTFTDQDKKNLRSLLSDRDCDEYIATPIDTWDD